MKIFKNYLTIFTALMLLFITSCSNYLDTEPITEEATTLNRGIVIKDAAAAESRMNAV